LNYFLGCKVVKFARNLLRLQSVASQKTVLLLFMELWSLQKQEYSFFKSSKRKSLEQMGDYQLQGYSADLNELIPWS
jgi:hypothetical protein